MLQVNRLLFVFLLLINFSLTAQDKCNDPVCQKIKNNTVVIKIYEKLNPFKYPESQGGEAVVNEGIGFFIGKGNLLTARHILDGFDENLDQTISIKDSDGKTVKLTAMGRCNDAKDEGKEPDICLLKTDSKKEGILIPRGFLTKPNKKSVYGIINKADGLLLDRVYSGPYLNTFIPKAKPVYTESSTKWNVGIELYLIGAESGIGNSGSPVFDIANGNLLGMTTTISKDKNKNGGRYQTEVIPVQTIKKYIYSSGWKFRRMTNRNFISPEIRFKVQRKTSSKNSKRPTFRD